MRRRFKLFLLLEFLVMFICSQVYAQDKLTLCHWLRDEDAQAVSELVKSFSQEPGGVEIVPVNPFNPDQNFYYAMISAPDLASEKCDLFMVYSFWTAELGRKGIIQPLEADIISPEDFFKSAIDAVSWNGHVWAAPLAPVVSIMYVNRKLLDAAKVNKIPSDWDGIVKAAKKVSALKPAPDHKSVGISIRNTPSVLDLALKYGGEFFDPKQLKWTPNNKNIVAALEFLRKLRFDEKTLPPSYNRVPFENGDVAFFLDEVYILGSGLVVPDGSQVFAAPAMKNPTAYFELTGVSLSGRLPENKRAAALAFINWLTGDTEAVRQRTAALGLAPLRRSYAQSGEWTTFAASFPYAKDIASQIEAGKTFPNLPRAVDVMVKIQRALELVLAGYIPVQDAMDGIYVSIKKIYEGDPCLETK